MLRKRRKRAERRGPANSDEKFFVLAQEKRAEAPLKGKGEERHVVAIRPS